MASITDDEETQGPITVALVEVDGTFETAVTSDPMATASEFFSQCASNPDNEIAANTRFDWKEIVILNETCLAIVDEEGLANGWKPSALRPNLVGPMLICGHSCESPLLFDIPDSMLDELAQN